MQASLNPDESCNEVRLFCWGLRESSTAQTHKQAKKQGREVGRGYYPQEQEGLAQKGMEGPIYQHSGQANVCQAKF